ncbi:MAG: DUF294 nucleotidyltransferase-like domain-containing protein [Pelistega sp.]|nr:DUF294 nucleotidyltransferase-like domain-containing protein [Pelistega sp.]
MEIIKTTIEHLKQFLPFQKMSAEDLELLVSECEINYFSAGEIILDNDMNDPPSFFYIVKQGLVESQREAKDSEFHKNAFEFEEGEGFPFGPLLSHKPNGSQFVAITDTFVYQVPAKNFYALHRQSTVFRDYCEARLALLLEESKRIIQGQYVRSSTEQQTLSLPLGELIRRKPFSCPPDTPISEVLDIMDKTGIGSMVVVNPDYQPIGIFTLHDVLRRVSIAQKPLSTPIQDLMTAKPVTLSRHDLAYEAALLMARHGFRHVLLVEPQDKTLVGVVSEKDLFSLQRIGLRQLSAEIHAANNLDELKACIKQIDALSENMMSQGVAIRQLTSIIATLNDLILIRLIELNSLKHPAVQAIEFAWMAMGSEGRLEQLLYTDQDNGIIFKDSPNRDADRQHLLKFAHDVNHDLDKLGIPLCRGNIMAMNPQWCLSDTEWRRHFSRWIAEPDPHALLNSTIFFDFRGVAGHLSLAEDLKKWLVDLTSSEKIFLRFLTQNALNNRPPLGVFRDFSTNANDAIDLKINGAALLVDAARIMALQAGVETSNTVQRFEEAGPIFGLKEAEINGCIETFLFIQLLRMQHHFKQSRNNQPLSNEIKPSELDTLKKRVLREAFRVIRNLQSSLALKYRL